MGEETQTSIARAIVTLALRTKVSEEEVIKETCEKGAQVLLPWQG